MVNPRRQPPPPLPADHYFIRSRQPLASLVFLLPLILIYELGARYYATPATGRHLSAHTSMQDFLGVFGAAGDYLPALAVIGVLLGWHVAQRSRWRFEPRLYLTMGCESLVLAAPLLMFALLVGPTLAAAMGGQAAPPAQGPPAPGGIASLPWQAAVVFSLGAGVYEELVFRLIAIALIHMTLVDLLGLTHRAGALLAVVASALLFAAYHFTDENPFDWARFVFYFAAGTYFAAVYIWRGFGIVAATHAFYDVVIVALLHGLGTGAPE